MNGPHRYLVALGSNKRHVRFGPPTRVLAEGARQLGRLGLVLAAAPIMASPPMGPAGRRYANGAVVLQTDLPPPALLTALKTLEQAFGRRAGGRRWGARVLDCDIVLWSGGAWHDPALVIPHPAFRLRIFVLQPAAAIAPTWRDPQSGLTLRQHCARLTRPRPVPR